MDVVTLFASRLNVRDTTTMRGSIRHESEVDDRDSGMASSDDDVISESISSSGSTNTTGSEIVNMLMVQSLAVVVAAAAAATANAVEQDEVTTHGVSTSSDSTASSFNYVSAAATAGRAAGERDCRRNSATEDVATCSAIPAAAPDRCVAWTAAEAECRWTERAQSPNSDDAASAIKRRPSTDSSCDLAALPVGAATTVSSGLASADVDEEILTIFGNHPARRISPAIESSPQPRHFNELTSRKVLRSPVLRDVVSVQRPSLNLYKMQRMRIGRRVSLMQQHGSINRTSRLLTTTTSNSPPTCFINYITSLGCRELRVPACHHFRSLSNGYTSPFS